MCGEGPGGKGLGSKFIFFVDYLGVIVFLIYCLIIWVLVIFHGQCHWW